MKRILLYSILGLTVVFLIAVARHSYKEVAYNLGSAKPVIMDSAISQEPGSFVSIKGQVNAKDVASLNHNGIDMYFYPMEGYGNRMFVVTDGKPLAKESIAGEKPIIGELKELSRIPFARSAYAELGIRTGVKYFAVKEGKEPNPKMVLTYAVLLLIGSLFIIPIIMEVRNLNNNKTHTAGASA